MNFKFIFLLICLVPFASTNFYAFKSLLNGFKVRNASSEVSSGKENESRSSLISENDHKFSIGNHALKDGLFRNNLVLRLQDMLSKKSIDSSEQDAIVNDEDLDIMDDNEMDPSVGSGLNIVHNLNNNKLANLNEMSKNNHQQQTDEDDEEEEEDEDSFTSKLNKKSVNETIKREETNEIANLSPLSKLLKVQTELLNETLNSVEKIIRKYNKYTFLNLSQAMKSNSSIEKQTNKLNKKSVNEFEVNDLKLPPRSKLVNQLLDAISKEIFNQANDKKSILNETSSNEISVAELNEKEELNPYLNETAINHPSIVNSSFKFDNNSKTTSYTYLDENANSKLTPNISNSKLLGNTLVSLEKILDKYTFMNLYDSPTINDTHNDRDLHQKEDKKVILKTNFADYTGYSNTEKSFIHGPLPPVQNLTDITYGNVRVIDSNKKD